MVAEVVAKVVAGLRGLRIVCFQSSGYLLPFSFNDAMMGDLLNHFIGLDRKSIEL